MGKDIGNLWWEWALGILFLTLLTIFPIFGFAWSAIKVSWLFAILNLLCFLAIFALSIARDTFIPICVGFPICGLAPTLYVDVLHFPVSHVIYAMSIVDALFWVPIACLLAYLSAIKIKD